MRQFDQLITILEAERAEVLDIQQEIAASMPPSDVRETRETSYLKDAARADLTFLVHGVTRNDRVTNPRLAKRLGQPGLASLDRWIERLRERRSHLAAQLTEVWPRAYRYTGKPLRYRHDGRDLQPNDVVLLTKTQAEAWPTASWL